LQATSVTEKRKARKILLGKPGGRDQLEDLNVDGRVILK
jgi:hypothetical protein